MSIKEKLSHLFCNHKYLTFCGVLNCQYIYKNKKKDVTITFWECCKCGHRIAIREKNYYYKDSTIKLVKLWEKHKINLRFDANYEACYA